VVEKKEGEDADQSDSPHMVKKAVRQQNKLVLDALQDTPKRARKKKRGRKNWVTNF